MMQLNLRPVLLFLLFVKRAAATARAVKASPSKGQNKPQQTALSSIGRDLDRSRRERQQRQEPHALQPIPQPAMV